MAAQSYILSNSVQEFLFLLSHKSVLFAVLIYSHSDKYKVISRYNFDLYPLMINIEYLFCPLAICVSSLEKYLFSSSAQFLIELLVCFYYFVLSCMSSLIIFLIITFYQIYHLQISFPIQKVVRIF